MSKPKDFEEIYREFFPKVLSYLRRLVGRHEAEDLAQEVFLKVSAALPDFRGDSNLSTWIYRIAHNTALDHLRKPSLVKAVNESDCPAPEETEQKWPENIPLLDSQLIRREMNDCIRGIVDGLPENYRAVLTLADIEGLKNGEIAGVLDLPLETVKIRLHRARARLKKELQHHCTFYKDGRNELACDRKIPSSEIHK